MRHGKKFNSLGRTSAHRHAMLANMAVSLLTHKRIWTTVAKAKALRRYVEPLITRARTDTTHSRRVVFARLRDKAVIKQLYGPIVARIGDRPGGYTRVLRTGARKGDGAECCMMELVDFNTQYGQTSASSADTAEQPTPKRKRTRRAGAKKATPQPKPDAPDATQAQKKDPKDA